MHLRLEFVSSIGTTCFLFVKCSEFRIVPNMIVKTQHNSTQLKATLKKLCWVSSAVLPLWSAFAEKVRIRTFWAKLVRKRSEFTLKSPNFIISPLYYAYYTLINCPNNCRSETNRHTIIIKPCTVYVLLPKQAHFSN